MNIVDQTALDREIRVTGYRPELAMQIISWLARYFLTEWGNDSEFRARLAKEVQEFLVKLDNPRNGVICAWEGENLVGVVAIDGLEMENNEARIRWFIVEDKYRGRGFGRFLFEKAIEYCQSAGYDRIILCTFKGKDPAIPLYEQCGFTLHSERDFSTSATKITELCYEKLI